MSTQLITKRAAEICAAVSVAALAGCAPPPPRMHIEPPKPPALVAQAERSTEMRTTILGGETQVPVSPSPRSAPKPIARGELSVNFPSADVAIVAKTVLGDLLHRNYAIGSGATGLVTLVTPGRVDAQTLLSLFETSLRNAGLALTSSGTGFLIQPITAAQAAGPIAPDAVGFGPEVITLQFINAVELKKLLDTVVPGVVTATDPDGNRVTIAGTTGQRASAHALIKQFDVNWLHNMSFALFVTKRTDSRLIVPELDKLLNAADAPTRGMVRLIQMESINGILAISAQRQYLYDVQRWIDVLDREGQSNEPRLFVYRVQNGRARDLVRTLNTAFGLSGDTESTATDPFAAPDTASPARAGTEPATAASTRAGQARTAPTGGTQVATGKSGFAGRISTDEVNNAVIVFGTPRDYALVEEAMHKLDISPTQVLIEAAITEVSLTDSLRFGVQWNFQAGDSNFALSEGNGPNPVRVSPGTRRADQPRSCANALHRWWPGHRLTTRDALWICAAAPQR